MDGLEHPCRATQPELAEANGFGFPILADYWPHDEVSPAQDTFDETFRLCQADHLHPLRRRRDQDVIASEVLEQARSLARYLPALESIG
jgi:hypothetical protein